MTNVINVTNKLSFVGPRGVGKPIPRLSWVPAGKGGTAEDQKARLLPWDWWSLDHALKVPLSGWPQDPASARGVQQHPPRKGEGAKEVTPKKRKVRGLGPPSPSRRGGRARGYRYLNLFASRSSSSRKAGAATEIRALALWAMVRPWSSATPCSVTTVWT